MHKEKNESKLRKKIKETKNAKAELNPTLEKGNSHWIEILYKLNE